MFRSKLFTVLTVVLFVFGIAMIDCAVAGEKIKAHGTGVMTKWQQMEVGDEEGHVIAIAESKQVYFNENTGEKFVSVAYGTFDINLKTGQGTSKGFGVSTYPNGDKSFRTHEGGPVGKGHWKGGPIQKVPVNMKALKEEEPGNPNLWHRGYPTTI